MNLIARHHWIIFGCTIGAALVIDQLIFHRQRVRVPLRRALIESACWIGLSLAFAGWIYWSMGRHAGTEFLAGYVLEKSLSLDNIFVFLVIFEALRVPAEFQPKVLYGGIVGALLLRAGFVIAGVALLGLFQGFAYVLGAFLVVVGVRMVLPGSHAPTHEQNWIVRLARKILPVTDNCGKGNFFLHENGRWKATPLLVALVVIETLDVVFAADSIPAVLSITRDTFIAYSSNAFAVLGLRALYFAVAGIFPRFRYLRYAIGAILTFAGLKMALEAVVNVSAVVSLGVICGILAIAIAGSVLAGGRQVQDGME